MATSQPDSHFSRKRSYDDVEDEPALMDGVSLPSGFGDSNMNKQGMYDVIESANRGSEDLQRQSQEGRSTRSSQKDGDSQEDTMQEESMGSGNHRNGSRPMVGECWIWLSALVMLGGCLSNMTTC